MGRLRWSALIGILFGTLLIVAPVAAADGNEADLSVSAAQAPSQVLAGDVVHTGTILVDNLGPHAATGTLFTAKLSGPGQYDGVLLPFNCHLDGTSVTCKLDSIAVGSSATVPDLVIDSTALGTIVESWTVTASQDDPTPSDNSGTVTTDVVPPTADLAANISGPATATGGTLPTTLSATNLGPQTATGVVLTDTFSGPGTFDAAMSDSGCSATGQTVTCSIGTLNESETRQIMIAFALTSPGTFSQTVHIGGGAQSDPNPSNDTASLTTTVPAATDLGLTLVNGPAATSYTYQELVWQLQVADQGPLAPTAVVVTGTLTGSSGLGQPGPRWDASQSSPGCSVSGATITCSIGSLAVGGTTMLDVAALSGKGTVGASFTVTSELPDLTPSDNSVAGPAVTVLPSTDLGVVVGSVTATPGVITVPLVATNLGPSDEVVNLTTTWSPSGAALAGTSGNPGPCAINPSGPILICGLGTLPSGGSETIDLTLTAPSGTTVTITTSVAANPVVFDPNQSNNSASVSVVVP